LDKIQRIAHGLSTDWEELIKNTNCEEPVGDRCNIST